MLLCGADMLESFIKPGVWFPEHVEEILGKHGVVCVTRWVSCWRQWQLQASCLQAANPTRSSYPIIWCPGLFTATAAEMTQS